MQQLNMDWTKWLLLLAPVILLQFGLQIYALVDLSRQAKVRWSKWIWVAIIIVGELLGPILYFLFSERES